MSTKNDKKIDRKEAIKRTGLLLGGVVFAPNILGVLQGCRASPGNWELVLFSPDQARVVTALADVILPADGTPAASEVGVPKFIEMIVNEVYSENQRQKFIEGLNKFSEDYLSEFQVEYYNGTDEDQYNFTYHKNQIAIEEDLEESPFILTFKEMAMLGYFTSELGATEVLRYKAIPGYYDACMPIEKVGRTWAT